MERNSMTTAEMEKFIASTDKYRSDFYKHYTGRGVDGRKGTMTCV